MKEKMKERWTSERERNETKKEKRKEWWERVVIKMNQCRKN